MATQTDLEPQYVALYRATAEPQIVMVPEMTFLMIDGTGDPETGESFQRAIPVLYGLSYTVRFALKRSLGVQHKVGALEGLWWAPDMDAFRVKNGGDWQWTMMIRQPPEVSADLVEAARAELAEKKDLRRLDDTRLESFTEGRAAQIMHLGPYEAEGPTIARLHDFIHEHGGRFDGRFQKHHEIYLGDPRRSAPERLRTILRQPFLEAATATSGDR
ncbi:hypothetical protein SAMN04515671_2075 [Nakamurella panacisegetis]|uniref:GyrI-like small molecule binding domain-containing protein n=1 Tax=Nakamurella panacisegetis TaxID=1090615 RepID=A0A1H0MQG1_9ACTN|nr:GyrI-like domain-containing protein [Nakamurella panacisegetis]SDO82641.1 hypothetical protein SAMN04515671_2075 [Nakamurella panacisegetis]